MNGPGDGPGAEVFFSRAGRDGLPGQERPEDGRYSPVPPVSRVSQVHGPYRAQTILIFQPQGVALGYFTAAPLGLKNRSATSRDPLGTGGFAQRGAGNLACLGGAVTP
jgi:hypothetical protein